MYQQRRLVARRLIHCSMTQALCTITSKPIILQANVAISNTSSLRFYERIGLHIASEVIKSCTWMSGHTGIYRLNRSHHEQPSFTKVYINSRNPCPAERSYSFKILAESAKAHDDKDIDKKKATYRRVIINHAILNGIGVDGIERNRVF